MNVKNHTYLSLIVKVLSSQTTWNGDCQNGFAN